jgi:D,D-heptose 1,7-bisphosphate phosphatase
LLNQAVFLVGGFGTRLGKLTQSTPKPLIEVNGGPFLDILVLEAARHGFDDILLLSGYLGDQMIARYHDKKVHSANVRVLVEPAPLGTAGALKFAAPQLADAFLLANGDTFFDINLRALALELPPGGGAMALCNGVSGVRYGRVRFEDGLVRSLDAADEIKAGPINGGIYALSRDILAGIHDGPASLERDVFPGLARAGLLRGIAFDGYFVDIGIPQDLERARTELPARLRRPALFLDRDGVLNVDRGYLHKNSDLEWLPGAREAVRLANDRGWFVFVVTNQAGVARGYYQERDVRDLHAFMSEDLALAGAHIDAFEYCPHHPEGIDPRYRKACDRRKPGPGMIHDLMKAWPVDASRSFLVGDMAHDVAAAEAAGIKGHRFSGGSLLDFVRPLLG